MSKSNVSLSRITLTFSLPDNFGQGWEYDRVYLLGPHHGWAGSYEKTEPENFAHEALHRVPGIGSTSMYVGVSCTVEFEVLFLHQATEIASKVQAVIDAFPVRADRQISVRGWCLGNSSVTEWDANDQEREVVSDMPFELYLAKHVPLSASHPLIDGRDLKELIAQHEVIGQKLVPC